MDLEVREAKPTQTVEDSWPAVVVRWEKFLPRMGFCWLKLMIQLGRSLQLCSENAVTKCIETSIYILLCKCTKHDKNCTVNYTQAQRRFVSGFVIHKNTLKLMEISLLIKSDVGEILRHGRVKKHLKESDLVRDSIQELRQLDPPSHGLSLSPGLLRRRRLFLSLYLSLHLSALSVTLPSVLQAPITLISGLSIYPVYTKPTVIALCWSSDDFYQNSNDLTGTLTVITQCSEQLVRVPILELRRWVVVVIGEVDGHS
ncbi:hypothetical protein LguiB_016905 [Lonicera macranthoides]